MQLFIKPKDSELGYAGYAKSNALAGLCGSARHVRTRKCGISSFNVHHPVEDGVKSHNANPLGKKFLHIRSGLRKFLSSFSVCQNKLYDWQC